MISIKVILKAKKELKRLSKKHRSLPDDFAQLLEELKSNPMLGTDLGKGIHKARMAIG